jgi:ribosomal protein S8
LVRDLPEQHNLEQAGSSESLDGPGQRQLRDHSPELLHSLEQPISQDSSLEAEIAPTLMIEQKGWQIAETPRLPGERGEKFVLTPSQDQDTPEQLTIAMINDFCHEKLLTRLRQATRTGLTNLLQDQNIRDPDRGLLERAQQALGNPQAESGIFHWYQLKEIDCWCLRDSRTNNVYIGNRIRNNELQIKRTVISNLKSNMSKKVYSKKYKTDFVKGLEEGKIAKNAPKISISVDLVFTKTNKGSEKICVIKTGNNKLYITDRMKTLSRDKNNGDPMVYTTHIVLSNTPGWSLYEIDPYSQS